MTPERIDMKPEDTEQQRSARSAIKTLQHLGYTDCGGELWKPPILKPPIFDSPRQQWRDKGKLYPCPNKPNEFKFWRLVGEWQWASDCWSEVSITGNMHNFGLAVYSIETLSVIKAWRMIVWKFAVIFSLIEAKK